MKKTAKKETRKATAKTSIPSEVKLTVTVTGGVLELLLWAALRGKCDLETAFTRFLQTQDIHDELNDYVNELG